MENQQIPDTVSIPQIDQNIENIVALYKREEGEITWSQRVFEYVGNLVGRPYFLYAMLLFAISWITINLLAKKLGWREFDPVPFFMLQGMVTLCAFFITTIVLIKQNRLARFEEQRQNLELQVNLITEQKTTKLINLIEELRRDLPMVKDRHDPEVEALQLPTNPDQVLNALHERRGSREKG